MRFTALVDKLDEKINPVLLRDLRLYGRGWGMLGAYFLTLAILVIAGVTYALAARWGGTDGSGMLSIPTILLALVAGALVPNLVGDRFRAELAGKASELALASPLTAGRLARGKIYGAWMLSGVVLSAAAPLFATAYLLGGVTPGGILGIAGGLALAAAVMPLPQIYLATKARKPGGGRISAALVFVGSLALMYGYAALLRHAFADASADYEECVLFLAALAAAGILYGQFLYFAAVSGLRRAAADRELWPRVSLALGAAAGGGAAYGIARALSEVSFFMRRTDTGGFVMLSATTAAFAFCLGMQLISRDNGGDPPRIVRDRRSLVSRALFSGGIGSLSLYFLLCAAALLACGFAPLPAWGALSRDAAHFPPLLLCPLVAYATGLAAHSWIVRPFFGKGAGASALPATVLVANVVVALFALFAMVLAEELDREGRATHFVYGSNWLGLLFSALGNPDECRRAAGVGAAALALLALGQIPLILKPRRGGESADAA